MNAEHLVDIRNRRDYVIKEFAGNKWGLPFGKKYVVERKDGTRMTLDDYSSLKKGALVYLIS
ncbi:MAG: hypothetical protein LBT78_06705 [Tannerella sp.]|jgi:hypothetical protein|nr:hypothetical protein [Tannerella sp.]